MAAYSPTALLLACDSKKKILKYFIILKINPQTDFGIFQTLVLFFSLCKTLHYKSKQEII